MIFNGHFVKNTNFSFNTFFKKINKKNYNELNELQCTYHFSKYSAIVLF